MVQQTSLLAYRKVPLATRRKQVLALLERATASGYDMSNMELAQALHWSINRVCPRMKELRTMGIVILSRKRKCGVTGEWVMAWKVKA